MEGGRKEGRQDRWKLTRKAVPKRKISLSLMWYRQDREDLLDRKGAARGRLTSSENLLQRI